MMSKSLLDLIANASLLVQIVMALLAAASIFSWTVIFQKAREFKQVEAEADAFEDRFWSGIDLADLYKQLVKAEVSGLAAVFVAGYQEFVRMFKRKAPLPVLTEATERTMRVAIDRSLAELEERLPVLATVGSTSPYIGLFGTVWGIMNSFRALENVQQATLSLVAPGIAEALIATAIGLFAAIPAVIAYNRYTIRSERLARRYGHFAEEFLCLLQQRALELEQ